MRTSDMRERAGLPVEVRVMSCASRLGVLGTTLHGAAGETSPWYSRWVLDTCDFRAGEGVCGEVRSEIDRAESDGERWRWSGHYCSEWRCVVVVMCGCDAVDQDAFR